MTVVKKEIKRILVPVVFSEKTGAVLSLALSLADKFDAEVILFHAVEDLALLGGGYVPHPSAGIFQKEMEKHAAEVFDRFFWENKEDLEKFSRLEKRISTGRPAEEILKAAESGRCDLVIMGTHGRGGFERVLLGSVAERVVRKSRVPVMVVNPDTA
jgi:nucleotide-binding universal stress UspA family protein